MERMLIIKGIRVARTGLTLDGYVCNKNITIIGHSPKTLNEFDAFNIIMRESILFIDCTLIMFADMEFGIFLQILMTNSTRGWKLELEERNYKI